MFRLQQCFKCALHKSHGALRLLPQFRNVSTTSPKIIPFRSLPALMFGKYLLTTNIVSSGVLMWLGDLLQQEIEYREGKIKKRYDYGRMARMFIVGTALAGPLHHYYYIYIARVLPKRNLPTVATKVGLDQLAVSPFFIVSFFYSMGLLERKPIEEMNEEMKNKFLDVYVMDCCLWIPTQFVNFYFIPVKYQVLYINAVTMLYNVLLSYIKHRDQDTDEDGPSSNVLQIVNKET